MQKSPYNWIVCRMCTCVCVYVCVCFCVYTYACCISMWSTCLWAGGLYAAEDHSSGGKATGEKGPMAEPEPVTYALTRIFSHASHGTGHDPSSPVAPVTSVLQSSTALNPHLETGICAKMVVGSAGRLYCGGSVGRVTITTDVFCPCLTHYLYTRQCT